jgi:tRNA-modifying protein YgfZ
LSAFYTHLYSEALLRINGPDTLGFLQGQTTCDTREVTETLAVPGAYCNPQGRMVCDFLLAQLGSDQYALRLKRDTLEVAAATFGKYIVFSKADIDTEPGGWQLFACWGDTVVDALKSSGITPPATRFGVTSGDGYLLVQMDDAGQLFEIYIDTDNHREHLDAIAETMDKVEEAAWQVLQIRVGIGRVEAPNVGELLPQMLNYDVTGHVNFTKGCYTGQEIVARLHYRGKAKRRMYLAATGEPLEVSAGTNLLGAEDAKPVGTLINSAIDGDQTLCLVAATEAGIEQGLTLEGSGQALKLLALPYSLDNKGPASS